jgi:hypothetical protein
VRLDPGAVRHGRVRGRDFRENFAQGGIDLVQIVPELVTNADAAIAASERPRGRIEVAFAPPFAYVHVRDEPAITPARAALGLDGSGARVTVPLAARRLPQPGRLRTLVAQLVQLRPVLEDPARELWLSLPGEPTELVTYPQPEPDHLTRRGRRFRAYTRPASGVARECQAGAPLELRHGRCDAAASSGGSRCRNHARLCESDRREHRARRRGPGATSESGLGGYRWAV